MTGLLAVILATGGALLMLLVVTGATFPWESQPATDTVSNAGATRSPGGTVPDVPADPTAGALIGNNAGATAGALLQ